MDIGIVFARMMMLLAMMALGFGAYKVKWIDDHGFEKLSKLVVNIFNPALIISGTLGAGARNNALVLENAKFVALYFVMLIVLGIVIARLIRTKPSHRNSYQLMTVFSNVGFMGIPVVTSILGSEYVIYVVFYIMIYNLLLYTYGIAVAQKNKPKEERVGGLKGLLNTGFVCSLISVFIFFMNVKVNDAVQGFFDYVGDATIPLSMMVIGMSVAKMPLNKLLGGIRVYIFAVIKLLIIPIAASFAFRWMMNTEVIFQLFIIMLAMPIGSIVTMILAEYGGSDTLSSRGTIITTIASIVTIPIVCMFI